MGWWNTDLHGQSFVEHEDLVFGDAPADVLDDAIDVIAKIYFRDWQRFPLKEELLAGIQFCLGPYETRLKEWEREAPTWTLAELERLR